MVVHNLKLGRHPQQKYTVTFTTQRPIQQGDNQVTVAFSMDGKGKSTKIMRTSFPKGRPPSKKSEWESPYHYQPEQIKKFDEILDALRCLREKLDDKPYVGRREPWIDGRYQKRGVREGKTQYEYVFRTVLGFQVLAEKLETIHQAIHDDPISGNNKLKTLTGITMHTTWAGAETIFNESPKMLLDAFEVAQANDDLLLEFFKKAFDKVDNACLQGRYMNLYMFVEEHLGAAGVDLSLADETLDGITEEEGKDPANVVGKCFTVLRSMRRREWVEAQRELGKRLGIDMDAKKLAVKWEMGEGDVTYADGVPVDKVRHWDKDKALKLVEDELASDDKAEYPKVAEFVNTLTLMDFMKGEGCIRDETRKAGLRSWAISEDEAKKAMELLAIDLESLAFTVGFFA